MLSLCRGALQVSAIVLTAAYPSKFLLDCIDGFAVGLKTVRFS